MSQYQKVTNLDFIEARDSEWQWHQLGHMQVCTSLQTDNHASTPPLSFLQASCCPTNSIKTLKANITVKEVNHFTDRTFPFPTITLMNTVCCTNTVSIVPLCLTLRHYAVHSGRPDNLFPIPKILTRKFSPLPNALPLHGVIILLKQLSN